jgi:HK97 family phage major capsid protein
MRKDEILALHEKRANIHHEMRQLAETANEEDRDLTAEEQESYHKMANEFEELEHRARREETLYAQEREVQATLATPIEKRVGEDQDGAPESFEEYRSSRRGPDPENLPEVRSAYYKHLTISHLSNLDIEEQRALSKASGAAGAFLVPTDMYNEIVRSQRFMGTIAPLAKELVTDSGETINVPTNPTHGIAYWTAENAAVTPSDEVFATLALGANKATTKIIVSSELLEDSAFNLGQYLATEFGERLAVLEETAFMRGDGTGKPQGILSSDTASNVTTVTAATGNATSFTYSALVTAMFSLSPPYRQNASWVVADSAARNLYLMLDSQNRPLWNVNIAEGAPDTFLGKSIRVHPDLATPAANNISVLYGDFNRGYIIRRVRGYSLQRQDELHSDNDQVGFLGRERVDGKVALAAAIVALKHSAT